MKRAFILLAILSALALSQVEETPATSPADAPATAPAETSGSGTDQDETSPPATSPSDESLDASAESSGSGTDQDETSPPPTSQAEEAEEEAQASCMGGGIMGFLPMIAIVVIFYFLMIRPQQKQAKQLREMRSAFQLNDRVITAGGIHGSIANIKGEVITVRIADGVKIDVDRNSLSLETTPGQPGSTG